MRRRGEPRDVDVHRRRLRVDDHNVVNVVPDFRCAVHDHVATLLENVGARERKQQTAVEGEVPIHFDHIHLDQHSVVRLHAPSPVPSGKDIGVKDSCPAVAQVVESDAHEFGLRELPKETGSLNKGVEESGHLERD